MEDIALSIIHNHIKTQNITLKNIRKVNISWILKLPNSREWSLYFSFINVCEYAGSNAVSACRHRANVLREVCFEALSVVRKDMSSHILIGS